MAGTSRPLPLKRLAEAPPTSGFLRPRHRARRVPASLAPGAASGPGWSRRACLLTFSQPEFGARRLGGDGSPGGCRCYGDRRGRRDSRSSAVVQPGALRTDVRQQLFQELQGVRLLTKTLELTLGVTPEVRPPEFLPPQETERAMEILKVLFNITFESIKREVDEEDNALYQYLGTLLRHCVMVAAAGDRTEEFHGHTVNLLGNLPLKCLDILLTLELHEGSLEFMGVNMDVISALLAFLEKRLHQTHRLKESVAPVLSVLTECARMHRPVRKFLKAQVLPPLRDVRTRPEVGDLLRNKLVRLMTHLDTDVKRVAAEFLFVLCSESVPRFIKYTGYGNAAGLLAARGLMAGGRPEGQYSEDEDTDTDEYKEAKSSINPVTGRVEEKPPNPMEGMTEEQKEHEAMKLVNMFDKLSRHRVIQPMGMSPRGHLTSLQDAMCETMEEHLSSDPDSDPD
ncbi:synembryn-A isoform X2 [Perognathus longimembris pacificus]|uniref:synembryn-A isoform X2 n=1 Tax=Perognathus longimembris pacificus TaxID=214514 RepID=UPI002019D143|nr:synembryn-A isoform X2 [Perognathus longimembris pacificus]